jgi:CRISPR/Cas system-associated exonuclease Cas4 (RecB family)
MSFAIRDIRKKRSKIKERLKERHKRMPVVLPHPYVQLSISDCYGSAAGRDLYFHRSPPLEVYICLYLGSLIINLLLVPPIVHSQNP